MRLQAVFSAAIAGDRPEKTALRIAAERLSIDFTRADRHVDVAVLFGSRHLDGELPRMKLDIFVANHVLHFHVAGKNACGKVGIPRDVNDDL